MDPATGLLIALLFPYLDKSTPRSPALGPAASPIGDSPLTPVRGMNACWFLTPFPLAFSGNGCVGADMGLGLGHQGVVSIQCVCGGGVVALKW